MTQYAEDFTENDRCPYCEGWLHYPEVVGCSCHIRPPCGACTDSVLTCDHCGWEAEDIEEPRS